MKTKEGIEIITARPKGMSFDEYKQRRSESNARLRMRLKGFLVYLSSCIYDDKGTKMRKTYSPFVGKASKLKPL